MADFARVANFRRQTLAESASGAFQRDAAIQLFVERLIDDAHASPGDLAHDPEPGVQQFPRLKRSLVRGCRIQRVQQEAVHPGFRLHVVPHLREQLGVA